MLAFRSILLAIGLLVPAAAPAQMPVPQAGATNPARIWKQVSGGISRLQAIAMQQGAVFSSASPARTEAGPVDRPSGRPDVFGSVALHVSRTPLDKEWRRVNAAPVGEIGKDLIRELRGRNHIDQLDRVNRWVNARIAFSDDAKIYRASDRWATLSESARRGRGDCEDYAIAKLQLLRAAGYPTEDLYLTIVKDLVRGSDHALLIARVDGRFLVLDNGTDRIVETHEARDYRPIFTYSAGGAFLHGYRRDMQLAGLAVGLRSALVP